MWTFDILPKIGQQLTRDNIDSIKDVIDSCLSNPKYRQGREQARSETWAYMGEAAVRTTDYLMDTYRRLNESDASENV